MKNNIKKESILIDTILKQKKEIEILKERIENIKESAIYYSKNNIKIH